MPLSIKTRYELEKRSADWPFKGMKGDIGGDFSPDLAEWLMLAQLYQVDVGEEVPVLTIAELGDPLYEGLIEEPTSGKASIARQFQDEIIQRLETGQSFSDLLFLGWVYQFWRKNERRPTVAEVGELMGLSRGACYRRGHTAKEVNKAYLTATGELKRSLPDPSGLDSIQRASLEAKKPGFSKLHHDPYSDD